MEGRSRGAIRLQGRRRSPADRGAARTPRRGLGQLVVPLVPLRRPPARRRELQRVRDDLLQGALAGAHRVRRTFLPRAPRDPTSSSSATVGASSGSARTARPTSPASGRSTTAMLTCSLHHWQFELATGRCLTSDDRHLRCERVEDSPAMSAFNHVGQCVTDLDRSKRFYCELFGFTLEREINPPDESSAQLCRSPRRWAMTAAYLVRDGLVLELLHFSAEGRTQPFRPRAMNEPGLTHISLSVDDIDAVCARIPRVRRRGHRRRRTSAPRCSSATPTASSSSSSR